MHKCWYDVSTYGITDTQDEDMNTIKAEILESYPIQVFNNEQLGEHSWRWDEMEEVLTALSQEYPAYLICATVIFEDMDDDKPVRYFYGNGHTFESGMREEYDALPPALVEKVWRPDEVPDEYLCSGYISVTGKSSQLTVKGEMIQGKLVLHIADEEGQPCCEPLESGVDVWTNLN